MCIEKLMDGIAVAKEFGAKRVITFVGMETPGIDRDQAGPTASGHGNKSLAMLRKTEYTLP
ncbi:MAG: hypothetical protein Ct9H300mP7_6190 [Verrucomicrobiota bacterium]|nr:MAG: hypothetical protein Ct9H300mP7_6190 [Verrucomicrobiota bacterium]